MQGSAELVDVPEGDGEDLESQAGGPAPKEGLMLGGVSAIPPGLGVVEGGKIPYQPWALAKRNENRKVWPSLDAS